MNYTIFDLMYHKYKIEKPIRLIEFFAGYGSQYFALKYLGKDVKHYKICEWAIKSIQAYNDAHVQDYKDYCSNLSDNEVLDQLMQYGVSINYNEPAKREQLKKLNYRVILNNIIATNNLVNIQNVKGSDLNIVEKEKYDYILTYSFPCQDLSIAGRGKGMSDTSTRSGMLWEVERILTELSLTNDLPQILLMENVVQVHGKENVRDFNKWQLRLEELGYKNYFDDLIATDYGIPQTRKRCFMISILGDYNYNFPRVQKLDKKLTDFLEEDVSEKYFIKPGTIKCFMTQKEDGFPRRERFLQALELTNKKNIAATLTALQGGKATDNHICSNYKKTLDLLNKEEYEKVKIRNLTPRECFRLMGVKDLDFENIAKSQSDSSLSHMAGDSIVVNVLMAIFNELF